MIAYYNEWEPYPAQWLRNLIKAGLIVDGDVDERSIVDVRPDDLKGYAQCHFFAGIGGWSYALRLAGWGDDRPVWTGSCPCQPFSISGNRKGKEDDRHLWPHWHRLIASINPSVVFGEQVAGAITYGWLDDTFDDLEREGYETGAAVLPACSVGAPHKRDRLWFVANARSAGRGEGSLRQQGNDGESVGKGKAIILAKSSEAPAPMANAESEQTGGVFQREFPSDISASGDGGEQACFWHIEPDVGRVANGIPARAHKLRAYGNAIVPQLAAEFIRAYMECEP